MEWRVGDRIRPVRDGDSLSFEREVVFVKIQPQWEGRGRHTNDYVKLRRLVIGDEDPEHIPTEKVLMTTLDNWWKERLLRVEVE